MKYTVNKLKIYTVKIYSKYTPFIFYSHVSAKNVHVHWFLSLSLCFRDIFMERQFGRTLPGGALLLAGCKLPPSTDLNKQRVTAIALLRATWIASPAQPIWPSVTELTSLFVETQNNRKPDGGNRFEASLCEHQVKICPLSISVTQKIHKINSTSKLAC